MRRLRECEIEKIIIELNEEYRDFFGKYCFVTNYDRLVPLGSGSSGRVYEGIDLNDWNKRYAIKVIGFDEERSDYDSFVESVKCQRMLCDNNVAGVVRIYDSFEAYILVKEDGSILDAFKDEVIKESYVDKYILRLQFIVMEKLEPVISTDGYGNYRIKPKKLLNNPDEIIKLGHDIGDALREAHHMNILHRDVKLENIFYSPKENRYKLGDFNTAKETEHGAASTIVYTKGYVAPEVLNCDEIYNDKADMYSLGVVMYVLLNDLKFPDSDGYHVNAGKQYVKGYVFPSLKEKDILLDIFIQIMCRYDAEKRFASMDQVLHYFDNLLYGLKNRYIREHNVSVYIAALMCIFVGTGIFKCIYMPDIFNDFSWFAIGAAVTGFIKSVREKLYIDKRFISLILLVFGVGYIYTTGITWWKIVIIVIALIYDEAAGVISSVAMSQIAAPWLINSGVINSSILCNNSWAVYTFISFGIMLLIQYVIYEYDLIDKVERNFSFNKKTIVTYGINVFSWYWSIVATMYALTGICIRWILPGFNIHIDNDVFISCMAAMILCIVWSIRERVLASVNR